MFRLMLLAASFLAVQTSASAQASPAQTLYLENCSACHKPNGVGVKGAFPALVGDPALQGDGAAAVAVVLNGRGGMPTFKAGLTDGQIADILTYVRSAWGNKAEPVTATDVAAIRARGPQPPPASSLQAH
jgi:mono/diheme cytochrome c family protein